MKIIAALLAAGLVLAGCSSSSDDGPAPAETPSLRQQIDQQADDQAKRTQEAQDQLAAEVDAKADELKRTVNITIKDGKVSPQGDRVEFAVGDRITLRITSDADEEIHVHSDPEHTYAVAAGESITESFTIDTPGQVAVEAHELGVTIVQLVVR